MRKHGRGPRAVCKGGADGHDGDPKGWLTTTILLMAVSPVQGLGLQAPERRTADVRLRRATLHSVHNLALRDP
ncbi:Protein of unknown function [Gryllus bimaculatus]|nr:Protein of unknown function [Gryllus bimaculatus]